jgi:IS6 family transposase
MVFKLGIAAKQCFRKVLGARPTVPPRVITVEKNAAYPPAGSDLQREGRLPERCQLRQRNYGNNVVEQDHRFLKRRVNPGLGCGAFEPAPRPSQGYEAIHMLRQGQCARGTKGEILAQHRLIDRLCGLAA